MIIPVVEAIKSKKDHRDAVKDLKGFSKVGIPYLVGDNYLFTSYKRKHAEGTRDDATKYSKAFRVLRNEIGDFSIEFELVVLTISEVHQESVERLRNLADEIFT